MFTRSRDTKSDNGDAGPVSSQSLGCIANDFSQCDSAKYPGRLWSFSK